MTVQTVCPVTLASGILLASLLWGELPAAIGIYALAFGDGLASLAGKLFGRVQLPFTQGKTAAGSLTCFLAIFMASFLASGRCSLSLAVAAAGMFIELLPLRDYDNVVIPIVLGGISQQFITFFIPFHTFFYPFFHFFYRFNRYF